MVSPNLRTFKKILLQKRMKSIYNHPEATNLLLNIKKEVAREISLKQAIDTV